MAFGTFFKKIVNGVKNLAQKAAPIVQKGLDVVHKYADPVAKVVDMIPGAGGVADGIRTAGKIAGKGSDWIGKKRGGSNAIVGQGGAGQRRFDLPELKG